MSRPRRWAAPPAPRCHWRARSSSPGGHPRLLDPELLATMMGHADEIDAIMDEWLADKDRREVVRRAQELRLPFTEVMEPGEVMADPHHQERGSFVTVDHPA